MSDSSWTLAVYVFIFASALIEVCYSSIAVLTLIFSISVDRSFYMVDRAIPLPSQLPECWHSYGCTHVTVCIQCFAACMYRVSTFSDMTFQMHSVLDDGHRRIVHRCLHSSELFKTSNCICGRTSFMDIHLLDLLGHWVRHTASFRLVYFRWG